MLGIPYAKQVTLNGVHGQECPICGKFCPPERMKDADSFVGIYAAHYTEAHTTEETLADDGEDFLGDLPKGSR